MLIVFIQIDNNNEMIFQCMIDQKMRLINLIRNRQYKKKEKVLLGRNNEKNQ